MNLVGLNKKQKRIILAQVIILAIPILGGLFDIGFVLFTLISSSKLEDFADGIIIFFNILLRIAPSLIIAVFLEYFLVNYLIVYYLVVAILIIGGLLFCISYEIRLLKNANEKIH